MRSLSFLLVTYYDIPRLFVAQIVSDVLLPCPPPSVARTIRVIKNCVASRTPGTTLQEISLIKDGRR